MRELPRWLPVPLTSCFAGSLTLLLACSGGLDETAAHRPSGSGAAGTAASSPIDVPRAAAGAPPAPSRAEACAEATAATTAAPPVVQFVIDTSRSMAWPPGWNPDSERDRPRNVESKWDITREVLREAVLALPEATALGASFFPNLASGGRSCIDNEVALPIAPLGSAQKAVFSDALDGVDPNGGTPTHAAYRFGLDTLSRSKARGSRFLVLITDGMPTYTQTCAGDGKSAVDGTPLVADAAAALARDGVRTFVIGSAGSESARQVLSRVAKAGGTGAPGCSHDGPAYCHFDMTVERELGASLRRAMSSIALELASCEYPIPAAPPGKTLDSQRVNVLFTPPGGSPETIPREPPGQCGDGWKYSADGRSIVLCPGACGRVQAGPGASVEVLFGCASTYAVAR